MAGVIYGLCVGLAALCAVLLLTAWRRSRYRLLLWGGLCFCALTLSNAILAVDKLFFPTTVDLSVWRHAVTLVGLSIFLYGLICDAE